MRILKLNEIFDTEGKIIIGVVHLKPLPGSPMYSGDINMVIEHAVKDARALEEGGVDGVIIENMGDRPFLPERASPETISAMTLVAKEVVNTISIPVGVNVLRNAAIEAAAIAHIVGGKFIRVNAYVEPIATDSGLIQPAAPQLLRYMKYLDAELGILADVHVKHATSLRNANIEDLIRDALERGYASGVVITGRRTGVPPDMDVLRSLKKMGLGPIIIGSGLREDNISLLQYADGAIVGTFFKRSNRLDEPVDLGRVREFINLVRSKLGL